MNDGVDAVGGTKGAEKSNGWNDPWGDNDDDDDDHDPSPPEPDIDPVSDSIAEEEAAEAEARQAQARTEARMARDRISDQVEQEAEQTAAVSSATAAANDNTDPAAEAVETAAVEAAVAPQQAAPAPAPEEPPSLRDAMIEAKGGPDAVSASELAEIDDFLASDAGKEAAEQYDFAHALENSGLNETQKIEAMGHFTANREITYDAAGRITVDENGHVATEGIRVADVSGGVPDNALETRTAAQIAADYAKGLNDTVEKVVNSPVGWVAGAAFTAMAAVAGGPVKVAISVAAGAAAGSLAAAGMDYIADFLAPSLGLTPEQVTELAIAGGTILGVAVSATAWRTVKTDFGDLKSLRDRLTDRVVGTRNSSTSSRLPGGTMIETQKAPGRDQLDETRIKELGVNHEQGGRLDLREGLGTARYESATGRTMTPSDVEGVDFFDGDVPVSLKGPLANKTTGDLLSPTDEMVDGLGAAVVHGAKTNTAARDIVVDTAGLSDAQREQLNGIITEGLKDFDAMPTNIVILE